MVKRGGATKRGLSFHSEEKTHNFFSLEQLEIDVQVYIYEDSFQCWFQDRFQVTLSGRPENRACPLSVSWWEISTSQDHPYLWSTPDLENLCDNIFFFVSTVRHDAVNLSTSVIMEKKNSKSSVVDSNFFWKVEMKEVTEAKQNGWWSLRCLVPVFAYNPQKMLCMSLFEGSFWSVATSPWLWESECSEFGRRWQYEVASLSCKGRLQLV